MTKEDIDLLAENPWLFLQQPPDPSDIEVSPEGGLHVPIGPVKKMLNIITKFNWGTTDFKCRTLGIGGDLFYDGSVQLNVTIDGEERQLTGAATFSVKVYKGHYAAVLLSNCIKNAAMNLGPKFGSELNPREEPVIQIDTSTGEDKEFEEKISLVRQQLGEIQYFEDAEHFLNNSGFRYRPDLKEIVNNKPKRTIA